jgi:hypothetical protein
MAKFLLVYYGGKMEQDPKSAEKAMKAWVKWFTDMGKAVVDQGNPTSPGKMIGESGVKTIGTKPVTGYSIIQADSLDKAVELAKKSPQIGSGGEIAVYNVMEMM